MLKLDVCRDSSNRVAHGDSDLDALDFEWHSIAKHLPGGGSKSAHELDQYGQLIYGAAVDGEGRGESPSKPRVESQVSTGRKSPRGNGVRTDEIILSLDGFAASMCNGRDCSVLYDNHCHV